MLNDVFARFQEAQAHLNFENKVIHSVEDSNARSCVRVPMLPLDREQALEIIENDRSLIGEKTICE